jgi:hypothetical protein
LACKYSITWATFQSFNNLLRGTGVCMRVLILAKEVCYHLSHASSPILIFSYVVYFTLFFPVLLYGCWH